MRAMRQKKRAEELQEKRLAKLLPRCQRAPGASCLKDIQRALMKNAYRRVEAVFDDVARVYRDSAQAAKDGKDPELLSSALCVQLCFEVMEDVRSRRPVRCLHSMRLVAIRRGRVAHRPRRLLGLGLNGGPRR